MATEFAFFLHDNNPIEGFSKYGCLALKASRNTYWRGAKKRDPTLEIPHTQAPAGRDRAATAGAGSSRTCAACGEPFCTCPAKRREVVEAAGIEPGTTLP